MNPKEYREFVKAYQSVYEQQQNIGVKTDKPHQTLQKMIDRQKLGGKVVTPKGELPLANSYEPDGDLIEDIEERRKQLARASREGIEGFKQRISGRVKANRKRLAKRREREQLKSEIKSELAREAVGDPINPNSVFKLSDPEVQKNLKSAATRMGPPQMKPKVEKKPQPPAADRFVKRMVGSTMLSPL
jgi:hypothetical protein